MRTKKIGKNYIFYKKDTILEEFKKNYLEKILEKIKEPIIIVLGGDGALLRAINRHHKKNLAFLGINYGNLGFLLNDKKNLESFTNYEIKRYPLLEIFYEYKNKKYSGICFNEINITATDARVLNLELKYGQKKINLRGDGVLIVTPAGSTAYNKSLYGPILNHDEKSFIITPKAEINHKKPIVFPDNQKIIIKNINRINSFKIYLDSKILGKKINNEIVMNVFKSREKVALIRVLK